MEFVTENFPIWKRGAAFSGKDSCSTFSGPEAGSAAKVEVANAHPHITAKIDNKK
jgi:hypothetical protein